MKKPLAFIACFAFLASLALYAEEGGSYQYSYARLSFVKGDVFIERAGDMGYEEGVVNLPIVEGDKLGTREGRAEIHFGRKNYLRIDSFTQLDFVVLPREGKDEIKLHVLSGNIFLRVSYLDEDMTFDIHTPDGSFYILEEGLYRFSVSENKETEVFVYEGSVEAAGEEGSLLVESEQKLIVSNGYFTSDPVAFYARLDDGFSRWNEERDSLHSRPVSRNYLPSELEDYETELANNGRWVYEQPYGYVWIPHVVHSVWQPYYYGRWSWYPYSGWNWVSYDPWGWCVSHFGRWHWRRSLGWYWIPTSVWGSAWVHWYRGYDYIGWCPLSYYGHPGVIVNNVFYGRHSGYDYPVRSRALTVIRKDQLRAPRISRVALSKNSLTRLDRISLSARQPSVNRRVNSSSLRNSTAARVLSRNNLRDVKRSYGSGRSLSSSRMRSTGTVDSSRTLRRSTSTLGKQSLKEQPRRISDSRKLSRNSSRVISNSSLRKSNAATRSSSESLGNRSTESIMKTYPSGNRSLSRSNAISSSKDKKSASSREVRSQLGKSSSKTYPSRLKREGDSQKSRYSGSFPSVSSSLRKSSRSRAETSSASKRISRSSPSPSSLQRGGSRKVSSTSARTSRSPAPRSAVKQSSSRSSSSVSSRSPSRSVSSRRSSGSSSKVSSSRSSKSSSSRVSRSSSRSSSSRSSTRKSIKKK